MRDIREHALVEIAKEKLSEEVDDYIKACINLLIDNGHANPATYELRYEIENGETPPYNLSRQSRWEETNYYGNRPATDMLLTRDALRDFVESGLDYTRCTDPAEHTGYGFAGTFVDHSDPFQYLKATLVSGSGNFYIYTMEMVSWKYDGFGEIISALGTYKDFAVQDIAEMRLNNLVDEWGQEPNWKWLERNA